jgi:hypothetical protein
LRFSDANGYYYRIIKDTLASKPGDALLSWKYEPALDGGSTLSPSYDDLTGNVIVPATVDRTTRVDGEDVTATYNVIGIEAGAFFACKGIDSLFIPTGAPLFIGDNAFHYCEKLKAVISYEPALNDDDEPVLDEDDSPVLTRYAGFSAFIDSMGIFAFARCGFTLLDFAADITNGHSSALDTLWGGTFAYCQDLDSVIIGHHIRNIRPEAFGNCQGLRFVAFDQGKDFEDKYESPGLDELAFTKCDSIARIHVRRNIPPELPASSSLKDIFQGINDTCTVYVPFNYQHFYYFEEQYSGNPAYRWGQWPRIKPSYAVNIKKKQDSLYPNRIDFLQYTLTFCGDTLPLDQKQLVTWSSTNQSLASVASHSVFNNDETTVIDYLAQVNTHATGKLSIKGDFTGDTNGEGVAPDSFLLNVRSVVEVAIKRTDQNHSAYIQHNDTLFVHVNDIDTLQTFLRFYGTSNTDQVKDLLVAWTEVHTSLDKDGDPYITRTAKDDSSFILPVGHDTVTYTVKVLNAEYSTDSLTFTVIAPKIKVTIASTLDTSKDSLNIYRATFLAVTDTSRFPLPPGLPPPTGSIKDTYPFSWKIVQNDTDDIGRPVADTITVPSGGGAYAGQLRVRGRRPGIFKIIAISGTKDSIPSDTFTVVVKQPQFKVKITPEPDGSDPPSSSLPGDAYDLTKDSLTLPVNNTYNLSPLTSLDKSVNLCNSITYLADLYGGSRAGAEWRDWDSKEAEYLKELTRLDSLVSWEIVQDYGKDTLLRYTPVTANPPPTSGDILLTALRHQGGQAKLVASYTFLDQTFRDTLTVAVPPIHASIYDREGDGLWSHGALPDKSAYKPAFLNRKDTIGAYIFQDPSPVSTAPTGFTHFSVLGAMKIDSVRWGSLNENVALVNDSGMVTFIDTGTVQITLTTLRKAFNHPIDPPLVGVSDTVTFKVAPPVMRLTWKKLAPIGGNSGAGTIKANPAVIRLTDTATVRAILTSDGLPVDTLASQFKPIVLDSTVVSIHPKEVNERTALDTFRIAALAHPSHFTGNKPTKLWLNDTLSLAGKRYPVLSDTFYVTVPPIYIKVTELGGTDLGKKYPLEAMVYHDADGTDLLEPRPTVEWVSLTLDTATIIPALTPDAPDSVLFIADGKATIRAVTLYTALVGGNDSTVYGVADTLKDKRVIVPPITVKIDQVSGRQTIAPQMTLKATVRWKNEPQQETDAFSLRWISRNTDVLTVDPQGHVTFVSQSVQGAEAFVVVEAYHFSKSESVLAKDSLKITVEAPVIRVFLDGTPTLKNVHLRRTADFAVTVTKDGQPTSEYDDRLSFTVKMDGLRAVQVASWNILTHTLTVKGIDLGPSTVEAKIDGTTIMEIPFNVPTPLITVEKVAPAATVFIDWQGGSVVLQAAVFSDGMEVALPDSLPLTWAVQPASPDVVQCTGALANNRQLFVQAVTVGEVTITATTATGAATSWEVVVPAPITSVRISNKAIGLELKVDAQASLPDIEVRDGVTKIEDYSLSWVARDPSILELGATTIRGKRCGSTWLVAYVTVAGGIKLDSIRVTVPAPQVEVAFASPGTFQLHRGDVIQLPVTITVNGATRTFPLTYTSTRPDLLSVGFNGWLTVTPTPNSATETLFLTATLSSQWGTDGGPWVAAATLTILPLLIEEPPVEEPPVQVPDLVAISLPTLLDPIPVHGTVSLQARVTVNQVQVDTIPVTFEVLTPALASLTSTSTTSALLTGKSGGQAKLKAFVRAGTIASNECTVVIREPSVTITSAPPTLVVKATFSPAVAVEYSPGDVQTNMQLAKVHWAVADNSILAVDPLSGFIQALRVGSTHLTATVPEGGISQPFPITVLPPQVSIRLQGSSQPLDNLTIRMSQTVSLEALSTYGSLTDTDVSKIWLASDPAVAEVDEFFGIVVGKLPGLSEVRVLTADGGKDTLRLSVLAPSVSLSASPAKTTIGTDPKDTILLTATVGYDPTNHTPEVPVIWTASPSGIVTVEAGKVTPLNPGTAVILATTPATYGGAVAVYPVVVATNPLHQAAPAPSSTFSARILANGLLLNGLLHTEPVEVYSPQGRILLRTHAGDGFIPYPFAYGVYFVRTSAGVRKVIAAP